MREDVQFRTIYIWKVLRYVNDDWTSFFIIADNACDMKHIQVKFSTHVKTNKIWSSLTFLNKLVI